MAIHGSRHFATHQFDASSLSDWHPESDVDSDTCLLVCAAQTHTAVPTPQGTLTEGICRTIFLPSRRAIRSWFSHAFESLPGLTAQESVVMACPATAGSPWFGAGCWITALLPWGSIYYAWRMNDLSKRLIFKNPSTRQC